MRIIRDGHTIYNSIDNTGSSNEAALGAQYAKGRLDTLDGRFSGYYTKSEVHDLLTGVAATNIVPTVPALPEPNTYYLVGNDGEGYVLHYYDTELEHAIVGSYELNLTTAIPQREELPTAGVGYGGKVFQYTGTGQAQYVRGKWYVCQQQAYYGWLGDGSATTVYTREEAPDVGDVIYDGTGAAYSHEVASLSGTTMTDSDGGTWTRSSAADKTEWEWADLADGAISGVWSTDLAEARVLVSDAGGKVAASGVSTEELGMLSGVTSNIQTQLGNIETTNLKSGVLSTSVSSSSTDAQIPTARAVYGYAVPKTSSASKVYGTNSSGTATNYSLATSVSSDSTDSQVPTAKATYSYAVAKTTDANKVYGSSNNFDRATSVGSSSTDTQLPTAKAIYSYAVPKTTGGSKIYGTNSSGAALNYSINDTYTSSADNTVFTRKGAYNLYNGVFSGNTAMVFAGNLMRNSSQSVSADTSTAISLTASDIYRSGLIQLASNGCKILVTGTYWFRFVGRLSDTISTSPTIRSWYLGGGVNTMLDDQAGGQWMYTNKRHKGEATLLRYCTAGEVIKPYVYIDGNAGSLQYVTMQVFKLNNK